MSVELVVSIVGVGLSLLSLLVSLGVWDREDHIEEQATQALAAIGKDMGNHEARIENIEHHEHIETVPMPSALAELAQSMNAANDDEYVLSPSHTDGY